MKFRVDFIVVNEKHLASPGAGAQGCGILFPVPVVGACWLPPAHPHDPGGEAGWLRSGREAGGVSRASCPAGINPCVQKGGAALPPPGSAPGSGLCGTPTGPSTHLPQMSSVEQDGTGRLDALLPLPPMVAGRRPRCLSLETLCTDGLATCVQPEAALQEAAWSWPRARGAVIVLLWGAWKLMPGFGRETVPRSRSWACSSKTGIWKQGSFRGPGLAGGCGSSGEDRGSREPRGWGAQCAPRPLGVPRWPLLCHYFQKAARILFSGTRRRGHRPRHGKAVHTS